ncbi:probable geranylgeranyl transferase type-2 subunit beta [Hylaeus volcanicus]|uniref:probable geranylgeranyl transferase type-2 subunit beta n=1 Tax=Hylaeus volcanicus TaxID=313075 RepID=UPI0023B869F3|nr:probable geranylgeranyl transferase type-2 subunit beta [Hylaeus volcanicus]
MIVEKSDQPLTPTMNWEKHVIFILKSFFEDSSTVTLHTQHLRMGNTYWGLNALYLLLPGTDLPHGLSSIWTSLMTSHSMSGLFEGSDIFIQKVTEFIQMSKDSLGGYGYAPQQDAHLTSTLYAICSLIILGSFQLVVKERDTLSQWIVSLQKPDGSFSGDKWGEVDARFMYCAVASLQLLGNLHLLNKQAAVTWIQRCENEDSGFGGIPDAESHAAYTYCCVASLFLLGVSEDVVDADKLGYWLAERQLPMPCGGFNGRPEKASDVCYSWWIVASLNLINRDHWVDANALETFIVNSQDEFDGGIADSPGNIPDVFHTFFGLAALSLNGKISGKSIHPAYCISHDLIKKQKCSSIHY